MIIKSMSRKSGSFAQLYDYLMREKSAFAFTHNLYASPAKREDILQEFIHNASFVKNSRGKNVLYHEMLALPVNGLDRGREQKILMELTSSYIELRASNHLVFGVMHQDKEYLHVHLMISANEIEGKNRIRLSKKQFAEIQKAVETYKNEKYPELTSFHYGNNKEKQRPGRDEQEMKHRRQKTTHKEKLSLLLQNLMEKSYDLSRFKKLLRDSGMEFYERGKTVGVSIEGKKYRLKTLGLEKDYDSLLQKSAKHQTEQEVRKQKRAKIKQEKSAYRQRMEKLRSSSAGKEHEGRER